MIRALITLTLLASYLASFIFIAWFGQWITVHTSPSMGEVALFASSLGLFLATLKTFFFIWGE